MTPNRNTSTLLKEKLEIAQIFVGIIVSVLSIYLTTKLVVVTNVQVAIMAKQYDLEFYLNFNPSISVKFDTENVNNKLTIQNFTKSPIVIDNIRILKLNEERNKMQCLNDPVFGNSGPLGKTINPQAIETLNLFGGGLYAGLMSALENNRSNIFEYQILFNVEGTQKPSIHNISFVAHRFGDRIRIDQVFEQKRYNANIDVQNFYSCKDI